jgi:hypothetical protein
MSSKLDQAEGEIKKILDKYDLKIDYEMVFPSIIKIPDEVKLALSVLQINKMKIIFALKPKKDK